MKKGTTIALLAAAILLLWAAGQQNAPLTAARGEYRLTSADPLENAPPLMAFTTVVLGGLRGLIADVLWLRVSHLQDEDRYFELVQLADWITKLEPRIADIWAFHAWNIAYNVSVMMPQPEDRWRWVRSGIELLRDEGLRYNPGDARIYRELGWMFQQKIGGVTDTAHLYYKKQWASDMRPFLDGPRPDYDGLAADTERSRRLKEEYRMDPGTMSEVETAYGPLDWRLPFTHAVYWAWRGRQHSRAAGEALACDRMIFQCMADSFMYGRLVSDPDGDEFFTAPHLDLLPWVLAAYEDAMARHAQTSVRAAYASFMSDASLVLYLFGREDGARDVYARLRSTFPDLPVPEFETFVSDVTPYTADGVRRKGRVGSFQWHLEQLPDDILEDILSPEK